MFQTLQGGQGVAARKLNGLDRIQMGLIQKDCVTAGIALTLDFVKIGL
jgi:hypothetical protein